MFSVAWYEQLPDGRVCGVSLDQLSEAAAERVYEQINGAECLYRAILPFPLTPLDWPEHPQLTDLPDHPIEPLKVGINRQFLHMLTSRNGTA